MQPNKEYIMYMLKKIIEINRGCLCGRDEFCEVCSSDSNATKMQNELKALLNEIQTKTIDKEIYELNIKIDKIWENYEKTHLDCDYKKCFELKNKLNVLKYERRTI